MLKIHYSVDNSEKMDPMTQMDIGVLSVGDYIAFLGQNPRVNRKMFLPTIPCSWTKGLIQLERVVEVRLSPVENFITTDKRTYSFRSMEEHGACLIRDNKEAGVFFRTCIYLKMEELSAQLDWLDTELWEDPKVHRS